MAKSIFVKANSLKEAITLIKLAIASSLVIACASPSPLAQARAQSLDLSTISPDWATCLGERAKDFDGGLGRCESAKEKTLKMARAN